MRPNYISYIVIHPDGAVIGPHTHTLRENDNLIDDIRTTIYQKHKVLCDNFDVSELVLYKLDDFNKTGDGEIIDRVVKAIEKKEAIDIEDEVDKVFKQGTETQKGQIHLVGKIQPIAAFRKRERPASAEGVWDRLAKFAKQAPPPLTVEAAPTGSDESIPRSPSSNIYKRDNTVMIIWNKLLRYKLIWVRGTPGSGKSVLAYLLELYILEKGNPKAYVRRISWATSISSDIKAELFQAIYYGQARDTVLIIDEAQQSYSETDLWSTFKNVRDLKGIFVIGFASYGSKFSSEELPTRTPNPPSLIAAQTITLRHIDHDDGEGAAGLLFTKDELEGMVQQWYRHGHPPIDQELLDVLFESTTGHIGAMYDFLELVGSRHRRRSLRPEELFTWKMFKEEFMGSPGRFMDAFLHTAGTFIRGLPSDTMLQERKYARALEFVVQYRRVLSSELSDPCLKRDLLDCVRAGCLHCDKTQPDEAADVFFFASPLHQWFIEWKLLRQKQNIYVEGELYDFAVNVIRQFNPRMLVESRNIRAGVTQGQPEAQYQDEFYRCAHQLSRGAVLHSEFGAVAGRIDFQVFSRQWGIELIRDGDRLMEHYERFQPGGAYDTTLELKDWIILDFRTTTPKKPHPNIDKLYHVVFTSDFIDVKILDNVLQLRKEFQLLQQ